MLDSQQKRKFRAILYHRLTLIILSILVIIVLHSTWIVYKKKIASENTKKISMQNVENLKLRDNEIQARIDRLATVSGVEEEIRSKFAVTKNGENMVIVIDDNEEKMATTSNKDGLWKRFVSFFFK